MEFSLTLPMRTPLEQPRFLPMSHAEMEKLGWDALDVLLISGDAYIDHPSFGIPLLGRWLIAHGYRVGVVAQPRWRGEDISDITRMGRPRLLVGISAGAIDSMLAHYTAFRRKRSDDAYTPGGQAGARPNRAVTVYANLVRRAFPDTPLVAGGIEASLRRAVHYDFWSDSIHLPILFDARLDLVVCGMGEKALLEAVRRIDAVRELLGDDTPITPDIADSFHLWRGIRGTARIEKATNLHLEQPESAVLLPSKDEIIRRPSALVEASVAMEREAHNAVREMVQPCGERSVVFTPSSEPLSTQELDALYELPFTRASHPSYKEPIPALTMIRESITSHRGCGGGCSFCSLALQQGRRIASRSRESILKEVSEIAHLPRFNGSISDIGGPSANMWNAKCTGDPSSCRRSSCMFPSICPHFEEHQSECVRLLHDAQRVKGVHHIRVASGIRFDLALKNAEALEAYAGEFTGGQLKIAPEHCSPDVLKRMRKPGLKPFKTFLAAFAKYSQEHGKEQYVIPYLMSAFPGCTEEHMYELKNWLLAQHWSPRQVQCFIPTPSSVATAMFYAGTDERGEPIYVARTDEERRRQHNILLGIDDTQAKQNYGDKKSYLRSDRKSDTKAKKIGSTPKGTQYGKSKRFD